MDQNLVDTNVMDQKLIDQYYRSQPKKYKIQYIDIKSSKIKRKSFRDVKKEIKFFQSKMVGFLILETIIVGKKIELTLNLKVNFQG